MAHESRGRPAGAPAGAGITTNGVFSWTPTPAQAPSTNTITVSFSTSNGTAIAGSDYVLKGTIKSRDRQAGKLKSSYVLVTFELTDLVTQELAWTGDYEMKTESEKSVINR